MENQDVVALATDAKELREKSADYGETDTLTKAGSNARGSTRTTATDKWVVVFEVELASAKNVHVRLVDIATQSKADAAKASADLKPVGNVLEKSGQSQSCRVLTYLTLKSSPRSRLRPQKKRYVS